MVPLMYRTWRFCIIILNNYPTMVVLSTMVWYISAGADCSPKAMWKPIEMPRFRKVP